MVAQPQFRSSSAQVPQRWLATVTNDIQIQPEEAVASHCRVCLDEELDLILLDCGHQYCRDCLDQHVRFFLDPKTFPPTCCGQTISVHKHSNTLSHAALHKYLRYQLKMARKGNIPCARARCKGRIIHNYLVEDEWGLCRKCYQMTCGRCHRLLNHHRGDWEARVCPTAIDLTSSDSRAKDAPKTAVSKSCSKCNRLIPHVNNQTIMPCPCGAIICRECAESQRRKQGLLPFGCWCKEMTASRSVPNEKPSEVVDPAASFSKTTEVPSSSQPDPKTGVSEQIRKGISVGADSDFNNQIGLPQPVVFPFQQPQLVPSPQPMQQSQFMQHLQQLPLAQNQQPAQYSHLMQQQLFWNQQHLLQFVQNPNLMQQLQTMGQTQIMLQQWLWSQGPVSQH